MDQWPHRTLWLNGVAGVGSLRLHRRAWNGAVPTVGSLVTFTSLVSSFFCSREVNYKYPRLLFPSPAIQSYFSTPNPFNSCFSPLAQSRHRVRVALRTGRKGDSQTPFSRWMVQLSLSLTYWVSGEMMHHDLSFSLLWNIGSGRYRRSSSL